MPRSTYDYLPKPVPPHQDQLHQRIVALSWAHPRYGYRRIRVLLGREGWMVSRKQVQHIRRQEGLKVRPKPQKIPRRGLSIASLNDLKGYGLEYMFNPWYVPAPLFHGGPDGN